MTGRLQTSPESTLHSTTSRGYTISYEDVGVGAPIVLIPGFTGSARQMREDGYVGPLAVGRRVLTVDPLGHGRSAAPHDEAAYRFPAVAADVVAVLDAAGLARAALWGYSRGAVLACMAAIEYPERVAALILGGGGDLGTVPPAPPPPSVAALAQGDWAAFWAGMGLTLPERQRRQFEANDPRAMAAAYVGECTSDYVVDLGRVAAPTLVYCGGRDRPEVHHLTAQALGVELQVVGEGNHPQTLLDADGVMPLAVAHLEAAGLWPLCHVSWGPCKPAGPGRDAWPPAPRVMSCSVAQDIANRYPLLLCCRLTLGPLRRRGEGRWRCNSPGSPLHAVCGEGARG